MKLDYLNDAYRKEKLYDLVMKYANILAFIALVFIEILILLNSSRGLGYFWVVFAMELILTVNNALRLWIMKGLRVKLYSYVLDIILLIIITVFSGNSFSGSAYPLAVYLIVLTEFYLSSDTLLSDVIMCAISTVVYCLSYALSSFFMEFRALPIGTIISDSFISVIFLWMHFFVVNLAIVMYRNNVSMDKVNRELDESNRKLKKAYEELKAVTLLQERQRIAKEIHDTAGHSITICIMQTEAAKLIIDDDPAQAKQKIISANLQAKHALEELRESVHVLAGRDENRTMRDALEDIIRESCEGTEIKIRSDIPDIEVSADKRRLIENTLKEGISNGLRHGGATAFYFELSDDGQEISFLLSDNGVGADLSAIRYGLGLNGLIQKAESLNGRVEFASGQDEGFEIRLFLPSDKRAEEIK